MSGIRRSLGTAPEHKAPRSPPSSAASWTLATGPRRPGALDAALVLVGFTGGFRRAGLVALAVDDVAESDDGLRLTLRCSMTDQEAAGRELGIPFGAHPDTCPVPALRSGRRIGAIASGPLFRPVDRHGKVERGD